MKKLVIFDLDGTLRRDVPPSERAFPDLLWRPGVREAVRLLTKTNWLIGIATNQVRYGGIGEDLLAVEQAMADWIGDGTPFTVDACPHDRRADCACRKPRPGLLRNIMERLMIDPHRDEAWMVGDKWSDVAAGQAAELKTMVVYEWGYRQMGETPMPPDVPPPDAFAKDIVMAARLLTGELR